jgi:ankyrin repeat-rich membrane spanning protein
VTFCCDSKGETPYNIDASSPKTILGEIFGARKINAFDDGETIMGKLKHLKDF